MDYFDADFNLMFFESAQPVVLKGRGCEHELFIL